MTGERENDPQKKRQVLRSKSWWAAELGKGIRLAPSSRRPSKRRRHIASSGGRRKRIGRQIDPFMLETGLVIANWGKILLRRNISEKIWSGVISDFYLMIRAMRPSIKKLSRVFLVAVYQNRNIFSRFTAPSRGAGNAKWNNELTEMAWEDVSANMIWKASVECRSWRLNERMNQNNWMEGNFITISLEICCPQVNRAEHATIVTF
jgi:hypothetical protein